jgi:translation initiation factor IF-3
MRADPLTWHPPPADTYSVVRRCRRWGIGLPRNVPAQRPKFSSKSLTKEELAIERSQRINEQIRITPVRVISGDGALLGIMPTEQAIQIANEADLDLVEVAPNERPPVCRIMDFGKFKYQQKKKQHKTHVHHSKIKEIRVRPKTGEHDIDFKVNQARGFLAHKDKVVISVVFRGREIAHVEEGHRVIKQILAQLEDISKVDAVPSQQGKRIVCTLSPK